MWLLIFYMLHLDNMYIYYSSSEEMQFELVVFCGFFQFPSFSLNIYIYILLNQELYGFFVSYTSFKYSML